MSEAFYKKELVAEVGGVRHYRIELDGHVVTGMEIPVPGDSRTLVYVAAKGGYLLCGIMDVSIADMIGNTAARVSAPDVDAMLTGVCASVSRRAREMGAYDGMPCREFICLIDR